MRPNEFDIIARVVSRSARRRMDSARTWSLPARESFVPPAEATEDVKKRRVGGRRSGPTPTTALAPVRRGGGGGAWRNHLSVGLRSGIRCFAELSESYKERAPEQIADDLAQGTVATARHAAGQHSFGPTEKERETQRLHDLATAFNQSNDSEVPPFTESIDSAIELEHSSPHAAATVLEIQKTVRLADRMVASRRKEARKAQDQAIETFVAGRGRDLLKRVVQDVVSLQQVEKELHALPTTSVAGTPINHLVHSVDAPNLASKAFSLIQAAGEEKGKGYKGFRTALNGYWKSICRPVYEGEWTHVPCLGLKETTACYDAGHCLCCVAGKRLKTFRTKLMTHIKGFCMKGTPENKLLKEDFLVVRFRGRPKRSFFGGGEMGDSDEGLEDVYRFWHLSRKLDNPDIPVFMTMVCAEVEEEGRVDDNSIVNLKATGGHNKQLCTHVCKYVSALGPTLWWYVYPGAGVVVRGWGSPGIVFMFYWQTLSTYRMNDRTEGDIIQYRFDDCCTLVNSGRGRYEFECT